MKDVLDKRLKGLRAVVIGGGLAGLCAAISLGVRGARVRLLERESAPGGRLRPFSRGDYRFTPADATMTHPQILGRLFVQADLRLSDFLEFQPAEPLARLVFPDGKHLDVDRDPEKLCEAVAKFSPEDAARLKRDLRRWERLGRAAEEDFLSVPDSGWMARDELAFSPALWKAAWPLTLGHCLRRYKTPAVPALFEYLASRHGVSIHRAPAILRGTLALELQRGSWIPRGGAAAVIAALQRICQLHDVDIVTGARVDRIELDGERVKRVAGQGFKALRADIVVSTIDPASTYEMLPKNGETAPLRKALRRQRPSRSELVMFLGCNRRWESLARHETVLLSPNALEMSRQVDKWRVPPVEGIIRIINETHYRSEVAPADHSTLRISVPAPVVTDRFRWSRENAEEERERVFARLRAFGIDKLREATVEESILTPADWQEQFHLASGSIHGTALAGSRGFFRRWPNEWDGITGLFQAGVWAHPGASAPLAVLGGMLTAEAVSERAG